MITSKYLQLMNNSLNVSSIKLYTQPIYVALRQERSYRKQIAR